VGVGAVGHGRGPRGRGAILAAAPVACSPGTVAPPLAPLFLPLCSGYSRQGIFAGAPAGKFDKEYGRRDEVMSITITQCGGGPGDTGRALASPMNKSDKQSFELLSAQAGVMPLAITRNGRSDPLQLTVDCGRALSADRHEFPKGFEKWRRWDGKNWSAAFVP